MIAEEVEDDPDPDPDQADDGHEPDGPQQDVEEIPTVVHRGPLSN